MIMDKRHRHPHHQVRHQHHFDHEHLEHPPGWKVVPVASHKVAAHPKYAHEWRVVPVQDNDIVVNSFFILILFYFAICMVVFFYRWMIGERPLYFNRRHISSLSKGSPCIVTVVTGCRPHAGTRGQVKLSVHSMKNSSNIVTVLEGPSTLRVIPFRRSHSDAFLIPCSGALGPLKQVVVELSTTSGKENWYLRYITVLHVDCEILSYVPCHKWLEATPHNPEKFYLLPFSNSFWHLWMDNIRIGMCTLHLWLAPWCSVVNSKGVPLLFSLTLCYALVSCLMLTHLLVYQLPFRDEHHPWDDDYEFTLTEMIYVLIADVLVILMIDMLQFLIHIYGLRFSTLLSNYIAVPLRGLGEAASNNNNNAKRNGDPERPSYWFSSYRSILPFPNVNNNALNGSSERSIWHVKNRRKPWMGAFSKADVFSGRGAASHMLTGGAGGDVCSLLESAGSVGLYAHDYACAAGFNRSAGLASGRIAGSTSQCNAFNKYHRLANSIHEVNGHHYDDVDEPDDTLQRNQTKRCMTSLTNSFMKDHYAEDNLNSRSDEGYPRDQISSRHRLCSSLMQTLSHETLVSSASRGDVFQEDFHSRLPTIEDPLIKVNEQDLDKLVSSFLRGILELCFACHARTESTCDRAAAEEVCEVDSDAIRDATGMPLDQTEPLAACFQEILHSKSNTDLKEMRCEARSNHSDRMEGNGQDDLEARRLHDLVDLFEADIRRVFDSAVVAMPIEHYKMPHDVIRNIVINLFLADERVGEQYKNSNRNSNELSTHSLLLTSEYDGHQDLSSKSCFRADNQPVPTFNEQDVSANRGWNRNYNKTDGAISYDPPFGVSNINSHNYISATPSQSQATIIESTREARTPPNFVHDLISKSHIVRTMSQLLTERCMDSSLHVVKSKVLQQLHALQEHQRADIHSAIFHAVSSTSFLEPSAPELGDTADMDLFWDSIARPLHGVKPFNLVYVLQTGRAEELVHEKLEAVFIAAVNRILDDDRADLSEKAADPGIEEMRKDLVDFELSRFAVSVGSTVMMALTDRMMNHVNFCAVEEEEESDRSSEEDVEHRANSVKYGISISASQAAEVSTSRMASPGDFTTGMDIPDGVMSRSDIKSGYNAAEEVDIEALRFGTRGGMVEGEDNIKICCNIDGATFPARFYIEGSEAISMGQRIDDVHFTSETDNLSEDLRLLVHQESEQPEIHSDLELLLPDLEHLIKDIVRRVLQKLAVANARARNAIVAAQYVHCITRCAVLSVYAELKRQSVRLSGNEERRARRSSGQFCGGYEAPRGVKRVRAGDSDKIWESKERFQLDEGAANRNNRSLVSHNQNFSTVATFMHPTHLIIVRDVILCMYAKRRQQRIDEIPTPTARSTESESPFDKNPNSSKGSKRDFGRSSSRYFSTGKHGANEHEPSDTDSSSSVVEKQRFLSDTKVAWQDLGDEKIYLDDNNWFSARNEQNAEEEFLSCDEKIARLCESLKETRFSRFIAASVTDASLIEYDSFLSHFDAELENVDLNSLDSLGRALRESRSGVKLAAMHSGLLGEVCEWMRKDLYGKSVRRVAEELLDPGEISEEMEECSEDLYRGGGLKEQPASWNMNNCNRRVSRLSSDVKQRWMKVKRLEEMANLNNSNKSTDGNEECDQMSETRDDQVLVAHVNELQADVTQIVDDSLPANQITVINNQPIDEGDEVNQSNSAIGQKSSDAVGKDFLDASAAVNSEAGNRSVTSISAHNSNGKGSLAKISVSNSQADIVRGSNTQRSTNNVSRSSKTNKWISGRNSSVKGSAAKISATDIRVGTGSNAGLDAANANVIMTPSTSDANLSTVDSDLHPHRMTVQRSSRDLHGDTLSQGTDADNDADENLWQESLDSVNDQNIGGKDEHEISSYIAPSEHIFGFSQQYSGPLVAPSASRSTINTLNDEDELFDDRIPVQPQFSVSASHMTHSKQHPHFSSISRMPSGSLTIVPKDESEPVGWKNGTAAGNRMASWKLYLLYLILLLICVISGGVTLALGRELMYFEAHHWLISMLIAALVHGLVAEPLRIIFVAFGFAWKGDVFM